MNRSLLAGIGAGSGLVLAGVIGASVLFPPAPDAPEMQHREEGITQPAPVPEPDETPEPQDDMALGDAPLDPGEEEGVARNDEPLPEIVEDPTPEADLATDMQEPAPAPEQGMDVDPVVQADPPRQIAVDIPGAPSAGRELAEETAPVAPPTQDQPSLTRLPSGVLPAPRADGTMALPQVLPPPAAAPGPVEAETAAAPDPDGQPAEQVTQEDRQAMPGLRVSGLPRIGEAEPVPNTPEAAPLRQDVELSALERNSLYQGAGGAAARMALVLNDPGLSMPMRRALAAMDFPFTVALNPLDSSAPEAAELYHGAGKEILILASSIPEGATASDLDVSFHAFFDALPLAAGVIDLPTNGIARNARLLGDIMPLLAQDGHGLLTFSGGLSQTGRAAEAAGVAHAEVFRVLDAGSESAFTIRRFLDRAVFQASQMGQVIVFGDASNDATIEAIEMWRTDGRADQVALVPVSGILLDDD